MKTINLGVIGFGSRGRSLARTAVRVSGGLMSVAACIEPDDKTFQRACTDFSRSPRRYTSIPEMLTGERLDGVVVSSPNELHLRHLLELEPSGLPMLLEKPLDATFGRISEVAALSQKYPAPILVGHCMRFAPILCEAKKMLTRGEIGQICSVRFVQNCHYGNGGYHNWRRRAETSGTWFIEKATHDFDIMNWLVQAHPVSIAAVSRLQAFGGDKPADLRCRDCGEQASCPESLINLAYRNGSLVEEYSGMDDLCVFSSEVNTPDNETALIQYDNGVFGTYHQWFFSPRGYHHRIYEIHGTLGAMEIDLGDEHGGAIRVSHRFSEPGTQSLHRFDYLGRNHYNGDGPMLMHFYDVILGQAAPLATVEEAFTAELIGYAAIRAGTENRTVHFAELLGCQKGLAGDELAHETDGFGREADSATTKTNGNGPLASHL